MMSEHETADIKQPKNNKVLLVEDTRALQLLVASYIRKAGLEVEFANNGEEGVAAAMSGDYAVVFMDSQMPVMDGFYATKLLRVGGYTRPIIAMTANDVQVDWQRYQAAGYTDYLAKPIQQAQVQSILARYVATTTDVETKQQGLVSTLFDTDPDLVGMIKTFLDTLPDYIDQCQQALASKNWEALASALHVLKGMGGSYGYPVITEVARESESQVKSGNFTTVAALIEKLAQLSHKAQHSYQQMVL